MDTATPIRVDNWRTVHLAGPYVAPEINPVGISGVVPPGADPRRPEGSPITTSMVVAIEGRVVTTKSGTRYILGKIQSAFRRWMRKQGIAFDWRHPIKVHP